MNQDSIVLAFVPPNFFKNKNQRFSSSGFGNVSNTRAPAYADVRSSTTSGTRTSTNTARCHTGPKLRERYLLAATRYRNFPLFRRRKTEKCRFFWPRRPKKPPQKTSKKPRRRPIGAGRPYTFLKTIANAPENTFRKNGRKSRPLR